MNVLSLFTEFYDGLSSDGLFFFWIIVFLFCFLVFLTVVLIIKNKKLIKLLKEEHSTILDVSEDLVMETKEDIVKDSREEVFEIEDSNNKENIVEIKETSEVVNNEIKIEEANKVLTEEKTGPYSKNVLRGMNSRRQTSPINIVRNEDNNNYVFNESYLREESFSPLEMMEDNYEVSDNMKFASEIVERMEEEIKPSNIELTDYEKKQEEDAIISYDELLKVKDKIYNITEDEETDEFIDELKSFRLDL